MPSRQKNLSDQVPAPSLDTSFSDHELKPRRKNGNLPSRSQSNSASESQDLLGDSDPMRLYLQQISNLPLLTKSQERSIFKEIVKTRHAYHYCVLADPIGIELASTFLKEVAAGTRSIAKALNCSTDSRLRDKNYKADLRHAKTQLKHKVCQNLDALTKLRPEIKETLSTLERCSDDTKERDHLLLKYKQSIKKAVALIEECQIKDQYFLQWQKCLGSSCDPNTFPQPSEFRQKRLQHCIQGVAHYHEAYKAAQRKMCEGNLRLVISIAKTFPIPSGMSLLDLVQEGNLGLYKGIEKFDPSLGFKFSTYAVYWIKQTIRRSITDKARTIRIPAYISSSLREVREKEEELMHARAAPVQPEDACAACGFKNDEAKRLITHAHASIYALEVRKAKSHELPFEAVLPDKSLSSLLDQASLSEIRNRLEESLQGLDWRTQLIFKLRYGWKDGRGRTLQEIADIFHISRERVRQIEVEVLKKLKDEATGTGLEDCLD
ncbi:MAG: sigma-70 family RNA polymerase sigma factor [Deltaproteobacteria bacterium]|nr:sigma-70 family RNA polymerase sigma factor [Deltaproteobacteria bacterium]